jgi:hypothetical protein
MHELSGFPYTDVRFGKDGHIVDPSDVDALLGMVADTSVTDLLVLAHGWNNDLDDARALYRNLVFSLARVMGDVTGLGGRRIAIVGVLWPSKKFAESDLIPGRAAGIGDGSSAEEVRERLADLHGFFSRPGADAQLEAAADLAGKLGSSSARREFADRVRSLISARAQSPDDGSDRLFSSDGGELMDRLALPVLLVPPHGAGSHGGAADLGAGLGAGHGAGLGGGVGGGPEAGAAGIGSIVGGIRGAARNLLNYVTYYEMKDRAGLVGRDGVVPMLQRVHDRRGDLGIHLAGHSFGGRVVAATAAGANGRSGPFSSLTLLQAAFSHYGFARNWQNGQDGAFRRSLTGQRVSGPVLVTHTGNDKAVGIAYALASRVAGQVASQVGDCNDRFGGIGRNGALKTPEAVEAKLLDVGGGYELLPARVHNLLADPYIKSHSDITGLQVAYAILNGIAAG